MNSVQRTNKIEPISMTAPLQPPEFSGCYPTAQNSAHLQLMYENDLNYLVRRTLRTQFIYTLIGFEFNIRGHGAQASAFVAYRYAEFDYYIVAGLLIMNVWAAAFAF